MPNLDATDMAILRLLEADGRISMATLAERVFASRATAYNRVNRLLQQGVIRRFTVDIDPAAVGLPVTAMIVLDVEQGRWPSLQETFAKIPSIWFAGLAAGAHDVVVLVRAADMVAVRDVVLRQLHAIPESRKSQTTFILEELVERPTVVPPDSRAGSAF